MVGERRKGMEELHGQVGHITGLLEGMDNKMDMMNTSIERNATNIAIAYDVATTANARIDKYRNRAIGGGAVGSFFGTIMIKWSALMDFLGFHHG